MTFFTANFPKVELRSVLAEQMYESSSYIEEINEIDMNSQRQQTDPLHSLPGMENSGETEEDQVGRHQVGYGRYG